MWATNTILVSFNTTSTQKIFPVEAKCWKTGEWSLIISCLPVLLWSVTVVWRRVSILFPLSLLHIRFTLFSDVMYRNANEAFKIRFIYNFFLHYNFTLEESCSANHYNIKYNTSVLLSVTRWAFMFFSFFSYVYNNLKLLSKYS